MVRTPSFDKNGIKKGAWSPEEDAKLEAYITRYGTWNWRELPKFAGLKRCGKSCRLRWMNYLRPDVKRGNYSKAEEDLIMELHGIHGNKWAMIALKLPGRTDNEIKNHWHTHLKKRWGAQTCDTGRSQVSMSVGSENSSHLERYQKQASSGCDSSTSNQAINEDIFQHVQILESCPLPPQASSATMSLSSSTSSSTVSTGGIPFQDVISSPADCFFPDSTSLICPTELMARESADGSTKGIYEELENIDIDYGDEFWTKPFGIEEAEELSFYDNSSFSTQNSTIVENNVLLASSYMSHYDESIVGLYWDQTMQEEVYPWIN